MDLQPRGAGTGGGRPGLGRGGYRGGLGGSVIVPYPVYASDRFYTGYTSVHNPPPGSYDPIFGGYNPGAAAQQAAGAPAPSSPTVIINHNFQQEPIRPQFRDYTDADLPEPGAVTLPGNAAAHADEPPPVIYLVALRDGAIFQAVAYWVQGDTLNYVTRKGAQNRVTLELVDRDLSKRLNQERRVKFTLPSGQ